MAVIEVIMNQIHAGEPFQQTYFFDVTGGTSADFQDLADQLAAAYEAQINAFDDGYQLLSMSMRIPDGSGTPFATIGDVAFTGLGSGDPLPCTQAVVANTTSATARPNRGWTFFSGWNEAANSTTGAIITGTLTAVGNIVAAILNINEENSKAAAWVTVRLEGSPQTVAAFNAGQNVSLSSVWRYLKSRRSG